VFNGKLVPARGPVQRLMTSPGLDVCARCPAAGSIRQALNRAITLVGREFSLEDSCQLRFREGDCAALRAQWDSRKAIILRRSEGNTYDVLKQTLKSCDRFFDVACERCDKVSSAEARRKWQAHVAAEPPSDPASPASWSVDPMGELVLQVRKLVGTHWARGISRYRERCLVPDQNGCLETKGGEGGTLGTDPREYCPDTYALRVGVVKTKGKHRVVTMQSARLKGILRPVHECLYDFLSRKDWLVRGDVTKEHARRVFDDVRPGEEIISGDYENATGNIFVSVPSQIANLLAESPDLSLEEREALVESFRPENLHWVSKKGKSWPILRGSMMGNLLSFPILCLLNRACWKIARDLRFKGGGDKGGRRAVLINGDDIAFAGDATMYVLWRTVTSHFGLVVNEGKTGVSRERLELNSRTFKYVSGKLKALRKPVLSFLLPGPSPSCLLTAVWEGLKTFSPAGLRMGFLVMRNHIVDRDVSVLNIPPRLRRVLLKERWFRLALQRAPHVHEFGVKRAWPVVSRDFRPPREYLSIYDEANRESLREGVRRARGVKVQPWSSEVRPHCRNYRKVPVRRGRFAIIETWKWRWNAVVLRWWQSNQLPVEYLPNSNWVDDHPDLTVEWTLRIHHAVPPPPLFTVGIVDGWALWPNGLV